MKRAKIFLLLFALSFVVGTTCAPTTTPDVVSKNVTGTAIPTPEPLGSPVRVSFETLIEGDEPTVPFSFKISPDGRRFAVVIDTGGGHRVSVNGMKQKVYDAIVPGSLVFSPDSQQLAYLAQSGGQEFLVSDGKEYKAYAPNTDWYYGPEIRFSPDSRHIAYVAAKDGKQIVVLDGVEGKPYDQIFALTFNPNNRSVAFWSRTGEQWSVVNDGKEGKAYDPIDRSGLWSQGPPIVFSDDGKHIAYRAQLIPKEMFVVDGKEGKLYDILGDIVFSPDWTRVAYDAWQGGKMFLVLNENESKGYERVYDAAFSPDGTRLMYKVQADNKWTMLTDDQAGAQYDELGYPIFSPDSKRTAYFAKLGDRWMAVVDGKEQKSFDSIDYQSLVFSPDSQHVAYTAVQNRKSFLVLDGKEGAPYDQVLGTPVFSPHSQHIGYVAQQGTKQFAVIDGNEGAGYDMVVRPIRPFIDSDDVTFFDTDNSWHYFVGRGEDLYLVEEKFVSSPEAAAAYQTATAVAAVNETKIAIAAPTAGVRKTGTAAAEAQATETVQAKLTQTDAARVNQTATTIARLKQRSTMIPAQATATAAAASNVLETGEAWQVVLSDKFDDNANNWPVGYEKSISKNKYVWDVGNIDDVSHSFPNMPAQTDFAASIDVRLASGSPGCGMGLIFGNRESARLFYVHDDKRWGFGTIQQFRPSTTQRGTSDAIVPGAPNRLTVIAQGNHMVFWVNGKYVGQAQAAMTKQGKVGAMVQVLEHGGCQVEFDNFEMRVPSESTAKQKATAVAAKSILAEPKQWRLILAEPFDSNVNGWPLEFYEEQSMPLATAVIENGVYHPKQVDEWMWLHFRGLATPKQASTGEDVFVSVETRLRTVDAYWPSEYGVAFRVDESQEKFYAFVIDEVNGEFKLVVEDGSGSSIFPPLVEASSAAIRRGETNRLAVLARGNSFMLFINDQLVSQVKNDRLKSGGAGIAFWTDSQWNYDVEFDNFEVRAP